MFTCFFCLFVCFLNDRLYYRSRPDTSKFLKLKRGGFVCVAPLNIDKITDHVLKNNSIIHNTLVTVQLNDRWEFNHYLKKKIYK